jgi:hypothetical protein
MAIRIENGVKASKMAFGYRGVGKYRNKVGKRGVPEMW